MNASFPFLRRWSGDRRGGVAIEMAFVLPLAVMMLVGTMSASQMTSVLNGMHFAVEEASRCAAVNKTLCATNQATRTYAQSKYRGPGANPTFVASAAACGRTVTATATYELSIAVARWDVPLSATACFPEVEAVAT